MDEADGDRAEQGQEWTIPGVGAAVRAGATALEAQTPFGPVRLEARLTAREREILLAGGLVAYARA